MAKEIERKFLVIEKSVNNILPKLQFKKIKQGYLVGNEYGVLRIRSECDCERYTNTLTMKNNRVGIETDEYEFDVSRETALDLFSKCPKVLKKTRYYYEYKGFTWEIDVFHNKNLNGLILAEIELPTTDTKIELPDFIDREVSGEVKYFNSRIYDRIG